MRSAVVLASLALAACAGRHAAPSPRALPATGGTPDRAANPLVGTWRLVSITDSMPDGSVRSHPDRQYSGILVYDASGHMTAQVVREPRRTPTTSLDSAAAEDVRDAIRSYVAYFGTYEVDVASHTVVHHVAGNLWPSGAGPELRRAFTLTGDRLVLVPLGLTRLGATTAGARTVLTWERVR